MNRLANTGLLQSWAGTKSDLMIGSKGKIHGWDSESCEITGYPQTSPKLFSWFSQKVFQDRSLAWQLPSVEDSTAISGVVYSRVERRRR
ncbi:rCG31714 [Rattus norvegicus]|nr:rCG31714 [Rattus norvegicus]